jgi:hypothetical protein
MRLRILIVTGYQHARALFATAGEWSGDPGAERAYDPSPDGCRRGASADRA